MRRGLTIGNTPSELKVERARGKTPYNNRPSSQSPRNATSGQKGESARGENRQLLRYPGPPSVLGGKREECRKGCCKTPCEKIREKSGKGGEKTYNSTKATEQFLGSGRLCGAD